MNTGQCRLKRQFTISKNAETSSFFYSLISILSKVIDAYLTFYVIYCMSDFYNFNQKTGKRAPLGAPSHTTNLFFLTEIVEKKIFFWNTQAPQHIFYCFSHWSRSAHIIFNVFR